MVLCPCALDKRSLSIGRVKLGMATITYKYVYWFGRLPMMLLELRYPSGLFKKRREFGRGSGFLLHSVCPKLLKAKERPYKKNQFFEDHSNTVKLKNLDTGLQFAMIYFPAFNDLYVHFAPLFDQ